MKLVYSRRALADLDGISAYYAASASPAIADSVGRRLEDVIGRISRIPESAPRVSQRSQVRVVTVVRYPFRIFYRVRKDTIDTTREHDRLVDSVQTAMAEHRFRSAPANWGK